MSTVYIQTRHPVTDDAVTVAFDCSAPVRGDYKYIEAVFEGAVDLNNNVVPDAERLFDTDANQERAIEAYWNRGGPAEDAADYADRLRDERKDNGDL